MRRAQNTRIGACLLHFDSWVGGKAPIRPTALGTGSKASDSSAVGENIRDLGSWQWDPR